MKNNRMAFPALLRCFYALVCNTFDKTGKATAFFFVVVRVVRMARTKQTACRSDKKGKLPPLGPPIQRNERWGLQQKHSMSSSSCHSTHKYVIQQITGVSVWLVLFDKCVLYCTLFSFDIIDIKNTCTLYIFINLHNFVTGLTVSNLTKGTYFKPPPMPKVEGRRRRRWRPGTQAMREVRNYMRTTNLLIPRAPFLWYVCMSNVSNEHSTVQYSVCIRYCRSCRMYVHLFHLF